MSPGHFLGGVAGVIWSPATRRYLLLRRAAVKDFAPGAWECVTGRVDQGEGFEDALRREVREELGVDVAIDFILGTTHFYRGKPLPENELLGVVYHCSLPHPESITLSQEHESSRWATVEEARIFLSSEDPSESWLLRVLARAELLRPVLGPTLIELARREGLELG